MRAEAHLVLPGEAPSRTRYQEEGRGKVILGIGLIMSIAIDIWAISCLISGLHTCGLIGLLQGFYRAFTGG